MHVQSCVLNPFSFLNLFPFVLGFRFRVITKLSFRPKLYYSLVKQKKESGEESIIQFFKELRMWDSPWKVVGGLILLGWVFWAGSLIEAALAALYHQTVIRAIPFKSK
ncbi:hypothetical protein Csa_001004 [Cucumis sativus]|uniref:Uncharacterized protein n=1 Tax=Cucumis sativus TaxID=3659 RepID=A0A0A0L9Y0_CUCSA|nr:hypothetical protein Csa_001004 [Cucumis sativus]